MALKVGELFASFNLDTSGIDSAVQSAENKMANMGKSLAIGGAAMTAAVTVPLKQAASAIYEAGSGFDAQMSKVFAIAGSEVTGSAEAMEALRQKALEMGSTTQFTASEAGEAMEYMAMAGWKTDQMLAAIGPLMNLAAAAGADLGTTSDIVTDAMTAFGYSATDTVKVVKDGVEMEVNAVEHFADVLAAASSNSNTNVTMLGESFKFAAPLAGALGYSVDDVAIALGLMANNGIKSSMAGTSLSRIIQNMAKPSDQTAAAMEALGVSLYNSKGEAKSLREIMGDFRGQAKKNGVDVAKLAADVGELDEQYASGKITEEQYTAKLEELTAGSGDFLKNLTQLAGARGLPGLLAIMNATDEDFEKLCGAIDNATGSASEMKRVMLDNAKGDITLFKSALEGLEITLWGLAENGFRKVVQEATKYVDAFRNADKSTQLGTLKMGALAAAIGPAMAGMGGLVAILPTLAKTFTLVSGPTALLAIGLLSLGAAAIDSNNDIGKTFVKGMTKAGIKIRKFGADVEKQLPALTQNMSNFLRSLSTGIKTGLPGMIDGLTSIITTGVQAISANMPQIANVSQTIVTTLANSIKKNAPKIIPAVLDLLTNMATALISNIPVVLEGMSTVITSLIKEVQNADWGDIGSKLGTAIQDALKEVGTLFKKLAMGDQYVEDASWAQVGTAMVDNILSGVKTSLGNLRDFFGSLLLGDDYDPDENWTTFGTKLIDKIFEGADNAAAGATEFVSGMLDSLAGLFSEANVSSATDAMTTIATRIITGVADAIPKLAGQASNILTKLSELLVGDGSKKGLASSATEGASKLAGAIITSITQAIPHALDAAGNVLDAGLTLATKLLDSISSAFTTKNLDLNIGNIVQALINNIVKVLGGVLDFGNGLVTAGTRIASELLNSLAGAFDGVVSTNGVSVIGEKIKTLAQNIINGIVTILPRVFEVGGKAISAGMKLASELVKSLAEGFTSGEGLDIDFAGVANGIIDGIVDAISNLPAFLGDVLSAGAQIANAIMTSISDALVNANDSGVASNLGVATADLIKGLLDTTINFANDDNVKNFMKKLGDGFKACMGMIGDFLGSLISHIFSYEGLSKLFDAGLSLGKLLLEGMFSAVEGIGEFVKNLTWSILIGVGLADAEGREQYEATQRAINEAKENVVSAVEDNADSITDAASEAFLPTLIKGLFDVNGLADFSDDTAGKFYSTFLESLGFTDTDNFSLGAETFSSFKTRLTEDLYGAVHGLGEDETFTGDMAKEIVSRYLESIGISGDALSDELYEQIAMAFGGGGSRADLWQMIYQELAGGASTATEGEEPVTVDVPVAPEVSVEGAEEAAEGAGHKYVQALVDKFGNSGISDEASAAMVETVQASEEPVAAAAQEVSDAAVQEFLLVMSEENGSAIATAFIGGMISVLSNTGEGSPVAEAQTLAEAARNAATTALRWLDGYNIGHNFGLGLLRGIESMIQSVADAAARLGDAAAGALSGAIQEGSPSKLTAVTGRNFGLGFINSILDSVGDAENAAAMIGMSAASSLEQTISDISGDAADQMSITGSGRRNEAEALAAENEKTAMTYASAIANALNGARVVMNGELVGELVTETVSEGIASRYAGMRYGTV